VESNACFRDYVVN